MIRPSNVLFCIVLLIKKFNWVRFEWCPLISRYFECGPLYRRCTRPVGQSKSVRLEPDNKERKILLVPGDEPLGASHHRTLTTHARCSCDKTLCSICTLHMKGVEEFEIVLPWVTWVPSRPALSLYSRSANSFGFGVIRLVTSHVSCLLHSRESEMSGLGCVGSGIFIDSGDTLTPKKSFKCSVRFLFSLIPHKIKCLSIEAEIFRLLFLALLEPLAWVALTSFWKFYWLNFCWRPKWHT